MIALRPDQERVIHELRARMADASRILLQAPTGFGKTVLASFMLRAGGMIVVHRQELVDQTAATLASFGLRCSFIAAGYEYDPSQRIQVAMIQTINRRRGPIAVPDLVVIDEAHHTAAASYRTFLERFSPRWLIGLTATPERLDGKGLDAYFDTLVCGPSSAELIREGHLSTFRYFAPTEPDLKGIRTTMGDYDVEQLAERMKRIAGRVPVNWLKYAKGQRTLVFAVNVAHSIAIVAAFQQAGIEAIHLDAKTPKPQRRALLRQFAEGQFDVVSNCNLFSEGYDLAANSGVPDANVECVVLCRPTKSRAMHLQQVGRALRPKPEPAIILDHSGNYIRHGLPHDDREWSLKGRPKRKAGERCVDAAVQTCPDCYCVCSIKCTECPDCGYEFRPEVPEHTDEILDEITGRRRQKARGRAKCLIPIEERNYRLRLCRSLSDFEALGRDCGYKRGWAYYQWKMNQKRLLMRYHTAKRNEGSFWQR